MKGYLRILAAIAAVSLGLACSKDELLNVDPEEAPGFAIPTVEVVLTPGELEQWIDSVFGGFNNASTSFFMLAERSTDLDSRPMLIFNAPIQDTVFFFDTASAVTDYDSLRLVVDIDTTRDNALAAVGTTIQLLAIEQGWDPNSALWPFAVDSPGVRVPWTGGLGGTLGQVLDEVTLTSLIDTTTLEAVDSIVFDLTEYTDSLLANWDDTSQVNTGLAMMIADSGSLFLQAPRLQYSVVPELNPDTVLEVRCPSLTSIVRCLPATTYIFDNSAQPPPVGVLQMGGVDGWRSFVQLFLPDSVVLGDAAEHYSLRGATINKAQYVITSLAAPAQPFGAEIGFDATAYELADNYTVLGAKTPVGPRVEGSSFRIEPDSLEAGDPVTIDLTRQVQAWADIPLDSIVAPITFMFRAFPEGSTFGYWHFGAVDGDSASRPVFRIVFTPAREFPTQ